MSPGSQVGLGSDDRVTDGPTDHANREHPIPDFAIDPVAVRQALESGGRVTLRALGTDVDVGVDAAGDDDVVGPPSGRSRGRPRSSEAHLAILQASLDLLAEVGYDGFSMEAVAHRAGVSKATVYRRWPSKPALVVDLIDSIASSYSAPDTGSTRDDLNEFVGTVFRAITHSQYGAVLTALASEFQRNPEMAASFRARFLASRRASTLGILRRGVERGDLRPDADLELVVDLLVSPLYYRILVSGMPLSADYATSVVDHVLSGVGSPEVGPEDG